MITVAVGLVLLVAWIFGHRHSRSLEGALAAKYPKDSDGIIVGARDIALAGTNGAAVLLVHGAGDTPQTMWHLADELHRRGYSVAAPLLPGHGRTLAEFSAHSASDWIAAVRDRYEKLRESHAWVGVAGLSMGGALSVRLAASTPDLPALALASPYLAMPLAGEILTRVSWLWGCLIPYLNTASALSVLDPVARRRSLGYGAMTAASLRALRLTANAAWEALPRVRAPTLIVQSTTDNRIDSDRTRRAFDLLGSSDKSIEWINGAGHVITVDFGWERVITRIADWMDAHRR